MRNKISELLDKTTSGIGFYNKNILKEGNNMKKFYYYAKLNDNNVCTEIVSSVYKYPKDISGYVELPEYNETVRYKKWLGDQWSQESYEPEIDTVMQNRVGNLEMELQEYKGTNQELISQISILEGSIMELTMAISTMSAGGVE